ncbi:MAG: LysR family transcriptional regulator [Rhizobiales bacterium]|nr:LysR family transcriptional regulator [Hyphomicrobiales bacterium]OJU31314.1 MAG: LysR family transcriptional regulator [Rhizobiales bacterium 68-8]
MRNLNHVHLNGLRALESAGRLGSLQAAADEIGVSPGAVSQQIIRAEARLGRPVFERTPRGLKPTEFGARFLERLTAGFRALDEAVATSRRHADDILTISVAPVLASKWLVPRLGAWSRLNPGIQLRLDASVALVDLDTSDIDIAIRVGDGDWPGVRKEFLLEQEIFPVCAPDMAARLGRPEDLYGVPVVRDANSNLSWDAWLQPFGLSADRLKPGNSFTDAALALDAAIAGQGVMLAWQTLAEYALSVGTLVAPFPQRARTGLSYWLVTSANRPEDRRIRGFKAWMKDEIAETARKFGREIFPKTFAE